MKQDALYVPPCVGYFLLHWVHGVLICVHDSVGLDYRIPLLIHEYLWINRGILQTYVTKMNLALPHF